jgi:hypothetical protein
MAKEQTTKKRTAKIRMVKINSHQLFRNPLYQLTALSAIRLLALRFTRCVTVLDR